MIQVQLRVQLPHFQIKLIFTAFQRSFDPTLQK